MVAIVLAFLATSNLFVPNITNTILTDPTVVSLGICGIIALHTWMNDRAYIGRPHILIIICALTFLPGVLQAADHVYGQLKVQGLVLTLMILVVTTQLFGKFGMSSRAFLGALGVSGVVVAAAIVTIGETSTFAGRASVMGLNPIGLGRMASLGAMLCVLAAFWGRGWWRIPLLGIATLAAYSAVATGSRSPLIAAGIGIVFTMLANRRSGSWVVRAVGVTALIAGMYAFFTGGGIDASSRLHSTDSSGRSSLWSDSLGIIVREPMGLGFGNLYGNVNLSAAAQTTGVTQYSHNVLLETAVEGGWIALVGLLVLLFISGKRLLVESKTRTGALLLAVWVFAVISAQASSDLVGNRLMWAMIGVGFGLELWRLRGDRDQFPVLEPEVTKMSLVRQSLHSRDLALRPARADTRPGGQSSGGKGTDGEHDL